MSQGTLRKWIEQVAIETNSKSIEKRAENIATTIRKVGEAGVVGSALGAIHSQVGLDQNDVPLDLVGCGLAAGAAVYFSNSNYSDDMSNVAADCMTIFSFRKTAELTSRLLGGKTSMAGEESDVGEEDPVIRAAREL